MHNKAIHITLALLLIVSTTGITITEHYCGRELVSVNILSKPDACCDNSGCCHNETVTVKLDADIINLSPTYLFELISSSISLDSEAIFNNNYLLSTDLVTNFIKSSDLPPPDIREVLSKLGTFLL
jgi:hypothetical protein